MSNQRVARAGRFHRLRGFTLIELVLVVVILGALASVALPKYADVKRESDQLALNTFGLAMEQATSNNRLAYALGHPGAVAVNTSSCSVGIEGMLRTPRPAGLAISPAGGSCGTPGAASMLCKGVQRGKGSIETTWRVHCAGN